MTAKENFDRKAALLAAKKTNEAAVIDAAIAETRSDFAQYHGLVLAGTDPITGAVTEYTTLDIDTASYNGTTLNAIEISLDAGTTTFATVTAHADDIQYNPPRLYYKATKRILDGTKEGAVGGGPIVGSSAYDMILGLGIQSIIA